ncbi:unnamed protein product [Clonostachys rosea f. rosea IK726]|uniref:Uncharacterized protein n=1 Tax=Clonostachys rosea f. rosea IK726 TaxID=1349383 RepID=A0ACA9U0L0_BIOOC|nr:unnamed protein product [Clonostachys rosea f. rosea IK726]
MGCCISRSSGPNSPYPGGDPASSSRAINPPPLSLGESVLQSAAGGGSASTTNAHHQASRRRREQRPLDQRINKPLRRHEWTSKGRTWTKGQLAHERRDFFDTRVTGRAEVLWDPTQEEDGMDGLGTAQSILSAAEILLPTGNLANGVYDSLGNYYALPEWIVCDPVDVLEDGKGDLSGEGGDTTAGEDNDDDDSITGEGEHKREKGKEIVDISEQIALRARLSENGRDYKVTVGKTEHIRSIAKKIAEEAQLPTTKKIRIAYMGKILKESGSLENQGWQEGHILNALVFPRTACSPPFASDVLEI